MTEWIRWQNSYRSINTDPADREADAARSTKWPSVGVALTEPPFQFEQPMLNFRSYFVADFALAAGLFRLNSIVVLVY